MANLKVCVIGAGIVGLSTAMEIQQKHPSVKLTVIAEKFNAETTSDGAAGLFEPHPSFMGPDVNITRQWIKDSFAYYYNLMKTEPESYISWTSGYNFSTYSQAAVENHYMKLVAEDYRKVTDEELEQFNSSMKYGVHFSTMIIPCRKILPLYIEKLQSGGADIIKRRLNSIEELKDKFDIIFNCTGLGAKFLLDNDLKLVPIRGHIVQVKAPWVKKFYLLDFITYIIPCGYDNVVTLGGTQDYGSFASSINDHTTKSIREQCADILPTLSEAPVVRQWIGFRPHRTNVRVEFENLNGIPVVHNYGHGGFGVTSAPGTAKYAVEIFEENHRLGPRSKL